MSIRARFKDGSIKTLEEILKEPGTHNPPREGTYKRKSKNPKTIREHERMDKLKIENPEEYEKIRQKKNARVRKCRENQRKRRAMDQGIQETDLVV